MSKKKDKVHVSRNVEGDDAVSLSRCKELFQTHEETFWLLPTVLSLGADHYTHHVSLSTANWLNILPHRKDETFS